MVGQQAGSTTVGDKLQCHPLVTTGPADYFSNSNALNIATGHPRGIFGSLKDTAISGCFQKVNCELPPIPATKQVWDGAQGFGNNRWAGITPNSGNTLMDV